MIPWSTFVLSGLASLAAVSAQASEPSPLGLWLNPEQGGVVQISECERRLCGRIVDGAPGAEGRDVHNKDAALRARPLKDLKIFTVAGGPPSWKGDIYNPADGGTYHATLSLISSTQLKLTGCIVWPLCRTQVWTRTRANQGE